MPKKKTHTQSQRVTIARIAKEMAQPRRPKSVRKEMDEMREKNWGRNKGVAYLSEP